MDVGLTENFSAHFGSTKSRMILIVNYTHLLKSVQNNRNPTHIHIRLCVIEFEILYLYSYNYGFLYSLTPVFACMYIHMTINVQRVYFLRILQFLGNEKTRKIANGPLGIFSVLFSFYSDLTFLFYFTISIEYRDWWFRFLHPSLSFLDFSFPLLSFFFFTLRFCLLSRSSFIYKRLLDSHTTPFLLWKQIRVTNKVASEFVQNGYRGVRGFCLSRQNVDEKKY